MAKGTQTSLALRPHEEKTSSLATTVVAIEHISALSEADRVLFKQACNEDHAVSTAETIFYPQGGGQQSDSGVMTSTKPNNAASFEVSNVRTGSSGRILHLGRFNPSDLPQFTRGEIVKQVIDTIKHDLNCRLHTGGHIVGLAVRHLAESIPDVVELKAQHYPDAAFVEFRGLIDGKHKAAIQAKSDQLVQQDLPVKIDWWDETQLREKGAIVPDNMAVSGTDCLRVVNIEGAGAYPCGGTHVCGTKQIGKIEIRRISRQKGVSKVSYSIS